ncbi:class I SAM-dependent methyltransferase [Chloroflexota bacterium]
MMDRQTRYERFQQLYEAPEKPPWDTGEVPPEVKALVAGPGQLAAGRALDVGCGTGLNAMYLAQHGWQVTGIDWIALAVQQAQARAAQAGLSTEQVRFAQADVTQVDFLAGHEPVQLWLDMGCFHGLAAAGQAMIARHAARLVAPGGIIRLYAWRRHERDGEMRGLEPAEVQALFAPAFEPVDVTLGDDGAGRRPSAWYWLRRNA